MYICIYERLFYVHSRCDYVSAHTRKIVYMYVCIHVHVCMHIHTYIWTVYIMCTADVITCSHTHTHTHEIQWLYACIHAESWETCKHIWPGTFSTCTLPVWVKCNKSLKCTYVTWIYTCKQALIHMRIRKQYTYIRRQCLMKTAHTPKNHNLPINQRAWTEQDTMTEPWWWHKDGRVGTFRLRVLRMDWYRMDTEWCSP